MQGITVEQAEQRVMLGDCRMFCISDNKWFEYESQCIAYEIFHYGAAQYGRYIAQVMYLDTDGFIQTDSLEI